MSRSVFYGKGFHISYTKSEESSPWCGPWHHYEGSLCVTCMLSGGGICTIDGNECVCSAGSILLFSADKSRHCQFEEKGPHERISFYISDALLCSLADREDFLQLAQKTSAVGTALGSEDYDIKKATLILDKVKTVFHGKEEEKEAKLLELMLQMITIIQDAADHALRSLELQPQDEIIKAICKYIEEHISEDLSYKKLQKLFYVSRYHLGTKFPQQTGKSLTKYVIFKRLICVCNLVRDGMGIEDAAYRCGFNTYSHFYKEFIQNFGTSPREYLGK